MHTELFVRCMMKMYSH